MNILNNFLKDKLILLSVFFWLFFYFHSIYFDYNWHLNPVYGTISAWNNSDVLFSTNPFSNISEYTLMIYMIGSDLESEGESATEDLTQMINAGSNSNVNVILQTGGSDKNLENPISAKINVDFTKVQRHQIINGNILTVEEIGHKSMTRPSTLSDFIKWGISEYPAKKYAIILWDHGSGINGFGKDVNFPREILNPYEMQKAFLTAKIETGVTFEIIGFDACLMSSIEIASRLQGVSSYMVSSEDLVPPWGFDYTSIIENLNNNPTQSGSSLGKSIIDSFVSDSRYFSESENYSAYKDITLSLIDLTKIPQVIENVNDFSNALKYEIKDLRSAISLSKSIDLTERYGQTASGGTGMVDLLDLTKNIEQRYPNLATSINEVQTSLNDAVIYAYNGTARPNANGLSIYMPLTKTEFSDTVELYVLDLDWSALLNTQKSIINSDTHPPVLKSIPQGDTINTMVYGSDVSNVFVYILTNSSKGHPLIYIQSIEPSVIDDNGLFQYKQQNMVALCNEDKCIPTTMNIENNADKNFAFIPIRIESNEENINKNISLVYEIQKDGNFVFLGGIPEVNPEGTVSKNKISLHENDKIFTKALPAKPPFQIGGISSSSIRDISKYQEDGPLVVKDGLNVIPKYISLTPPYAVSFTMCDYSDNCDKTRWYSSHSSKQTLSSSSSEPELGYTEITKKDNVSLGGGRSFNTYANPTFGFKIDYPSDWIIEGQNISDFSDYDLKADPIIAHLFPSKYQGIMGSDFRPGITISVTDWPFKEHPKSFFDFIRKAYPDHTIVYSGPEIIAGNPSFRVVKEAFSEAEQFLGVAKEKRAEMILTTLMNGRMYNIDFSSYASQFNSYLPTVEKMIRSFGPNIVNNEEINDLEPRSNISTNFTFNNSKSLDYVPDKNLTELATFATYTDNKYGYSFIYPSNLGLGKPVSMAPNAIGNLFLLGNSTESVSEGGVHVSITTVRENETKLIKKYFPYNKNIKNLEFDNIISIAKERLSIFEYFPNFVLIQNKTSIINNNLVHIQEYEYFNPVYRSAQHEQLVYMIRDDILFTFEFGAPPSKYQQYLPVFEKMINSLEVKNRS
jgi:hypothetical protein